MISFPNAKINLGLNVLESREDGFHNIETIMLPISMCDSLEIIIDHQVGKNSCELKVFGNVVNGTDSDNLCYKAYQVLAERFDLQAVKIRLLKKIPMGAGLGGGSADAAFTIKMLNQLFRLDLSNKAMQEICTELGSDCSFFIDNKSALVSGRGEQLNSIELNLAGYQIVVVYPDIHIHTGEAYAAIRPDINKTGQLAGIVQQSIDEWKNKITNDFEISAFDLYPELKVIKEHLYEQGAIYASMTGSGSALFGIFERKLDAGMELKKYQVAYCKFL